MTSPYVTVAACAVLIVLAFAGMIVRRNKAARSQFQKDTDSSWGQESPRLFLADDLAKIRRFSDAVPSAPDSWTIDDITANDVDLDTLFARIGRPVSSAGLEVLYMWLRHPLLKKEPHEARRKLIASAASDPEARKEAQWILSRGGDVILDRSASRWRLAGDSVYGYIETLRNTEPIGGKRYILPGFLTLCGLLMLFIRPLVGILILVPALFINFRIHMKMRETSGRAVRAMQGVLRLIRLSSELSGTDFAKKAGIDRELKDRAAAFSGFRRGSYLVTSGGSVGYGIADAVLEYLKMFFHIDLVRFDSMLHAYEGHEEDALRLLTLVGSADAAIAAASYMEAHPEYSVPGLSESSSAFVEITDMRHPLLKDAVPNSVTADGQVLLTGSNASGKSTFLKNVVLSAIMAQSICAAPAKAYRAPYFRIATSMALTDNLMGGESYFIVEIRSLLRIMKAAEEGGIPFLAAIDEVLRGTNTVERIAASSEILKALDRDGALIFAATHDVELTYLLEGVYRNLHFRETVENGDVLFDYKLREGRADGRNALKLLSAAGYDPHVIASAEQLAAHFEQEGRWI